MPRRKKNQNKDLDKNDPEAMKEAGNKAYADKNFAEAVKCYSRAIELTLEKPNHVYFANRANAQLALFNFQECIDDCKSAIEIDPTYSKSYLRMARAHYSNDDLAKAIAAVELGLETEPSSEEIQQLRDKIYGDLTIVADIYLKKIQEKIAKHDEIVKMPQWQARSDVQKANDTMYLCISMLMSADGLRKSHPDLGSFFKDRFTDSCDWFMKHMTDAFVTINANLAQDTMEVDNKKLNCILAISFFSDALGVYFSRDDMKQMGVQVSEMSETYREKWMQVREESGVDGGDASDFIYETFFDCAPGGGAKQQFEAPAMTDIANLDYVD